MSHPSPRRTESRNQKRRSFFQAWKASQGTGLSRRPRFEALEDRRLLAILYFSEDNNANGLHSLNTSTGAAALVGAGITGVSAGTVGLTESDDPNILYGSEPFGLLRINADGSGATTFGAEGIEGLAFDPLSGILYGTINTAFFTLNRTTGAIQNNLASAPVDIDGIEFGDGFIYGLEGGGASQLYRYDIGADTWTAIGATSVVFDNAGLAFDSTQNVLYAKGDQDSNLYRIDPDTAVTTLVGNTGIAAGGGLTLVQTDADLQVTYSVRPASTVGTDNTVWWEGEVVNHGPAIARDVTISTRIFGFPAADIRVSSCAFSVSESGGSITQFTCNTGMVTGNNEEIGLFGTNLIEVGGVVRFNFRVQTVNSGALFSTAHATSTTNDPALANNSADLELFVTPNIYVDDEGNLIIRDVASEGRDDNLTLALDGAGDLVISDPGNTLTEGLSVGFGGQQSEGAAPANQVTVDLNGVNRIIIDTGLGDDSVTIDLSGGLLPVDVSYAGGTQVDDLQIIGDPGVIVNSAYTPGPETGRGQISYTTTDVAPVSFNVEFTGLEPVVDLVPAAMATVNATNGDNAINYTQGSVAANGLVSVDGLETYEFSNKTNLVINGLAGSDTINLNNPGTPTGLTGINVSGDVADHDTLVYSGVSGADDNFVVTPTADHSGTLTDTLPARPDVHFTGMSALSLIGQLGDLDSVQQTGTTNSDTIVWSPGDFTSSGHVSGYALGETFTFTPLSYEGILGSGFAHIILGSAFGIGPSGGFDTIQLNGTSGDDTFSTFGIFGGGVSRTGISVIPDATPRLINGADVFFDHAGGTSEVILAGGGGINSMILSFDSPGLPTDVLYSVKGSGADSLFYRAPTGVSTTVVVRETGDSEIFTATPLFDPLVKFSGIATASISGYAGAAQPVTYQRGFPAGANIDVTPGQFSTRVEYSAGGPVVDVSSASSFTIANPWAYDPNNAKDALTVNATVADDIIGVTSTQATVNSLLPVQYTAGDFAALTVNGLSGNDTLTVDNSTGLVTIPVTFSGGTGADELRLIGSTAVDSSTYTPGSSNDAGTVTHTLGGATQSISFTGLEPVLDLVAGPLVVNGTNADNAINYTQGSTAANGLVSIDGFETIEFSNKTTLTINALAGNDTINLNALAVPTGLGSVSVDGGAGSDDQLVVNGLFGGAVVNFAPIGSDTGSVTVAGLITLPVTNYTTTEKVLYVGRSGGDDLTVTSPRLGAEITFTPGATQDSGFVTQHGFADATELTPFEFRDLGGLGELTFVQADGAQNSGLDVHGTSQDDQFTLNAAGDVIVTKLPFGPQVAPQIHTPGVAFLRLIGEQGDDTFNVAGNHPIPAGVSVQGGDPGGSDTLDFTGTGGAITGDYGAGTIAEAGFGPVFLSGVALLNINASGGDLMTRGTSSDETLDITIDGTNSGTATSSVIGAPVTTFVNVGTLAVDLLDGDNTLRLHYGSDPETIDVNGATGVVTATNDATATALETVNFTNVDSLRVFGNEGNDAFTVTPSATMPIFIDGGDPIGTIPGDSLHVNGAIGFFSGPEDDEGGYLTPGETVSFDHIESLSVTPVEGCPFLIIGTNGDDDITIIARDDSTHAGADGVQDFTFSINGGPSVLVLNAPDLYIDALAGDDDIVIRAPAPNDAAWGVNVRVAGGPPSIGEPNEADRLVLETPGQDNIVFTPTGPDSGSILVDDVINGVFDVGIDTLITFGSFVFVCPEIDFTHVSSPGGVELVEYDGESPVGSALPTDVITIAGTEGNDVTTLQPALIGTGSFVSGFSPLFNFRSFSQVTVNPGAGGFDQVIVNGSEGPDGVLSTADTLTGLGAAVTIGAGIDQLNLNTLGGDDTITLALAVAGLAKIIDAGAGNDTVDLSGVAVDPADPTIFGGLGDDIIIGSPNADLIYGGSGNDTINGGGGNDQLYGDEGNDTLDGDAGADQMFGGDGSDTFIWDPGDGSDLVEGGANESDVLVFNGSAAAENFELNAVGTRVQLLRNLGNISMDIAGVETIDLNTGDGSDSVIVRDLFATDVRFVDLDSAANGDDAFDIRGRNVSDNINVAFDGTATQVTGLQYDIRITGANPVVGAGGDRFILFANGGNDTITTVGNLAAQFAPEDFTLNGNQGDDFISGYGTLVGESGNDTLIGDGSAQTIDGGSGDDYIVGGSGADVLLGGPGEDVFVPGFDGQIDTIDGGADFDTILVSGTSGNDRIDAIQDSTTQLRYVVGGVLDQLDPTGVGDTGPREIDTLVEGTVEELRIVAGSGDDIIRVAHSDQLIVDGDEALSVRFTVEGGAAGTSDRLSVTDLGFGDTTIHRIGGAAGSGSFAVGALARVVYSDIEFATLNPNDPVTGQTGSDLNGRLFVFKYDPYEENNSRLNATYLGAGSTINVDPTIDPGGDALFGLPGDEDWYRIVADKTGTLDIQVYFRQQDLLANGRAGLPGIGNLDATLFDADGLPAEIAGAGTFGTIDATDDERIRIPAVAGQTYYLRVRGATSDAVNVYNVSVINTPAPVPFDLELDDVIATSSVAGGISFTLVDQRFNGGAALPATNDFFNGKDVYFTEGNLNGQRGRVVDYIGATRTFIFAPNTFSTAIGPLAIGDDFQIESVDTGRSQLDNITRDNTPTIFIRVADSELLNDIPDNDGNPGLPPDEIITIPFVASTANNAPSAGFRVAVFRTENDTHTHVGYAQQVAGSPGVYSFTFPTAIPDGSHFIAARVEMIDPASPEQAQGFGAFSQSLEIVVDTQPPPVFFGLPNVPGDGLLPGSDTGLNTNPETLIDLVTSVTNPGFFGQAEADAVIRLFIDAPQPGFPTGNGIFEPAIDFQIGFDVAEPFDGTNQYPTGYWEVDAINVNLNAPPFDPVDGLRRIFITAEDVAGNINPSAGLGQVIQELEIFIDTQGPQITDVEINNVGNPYDLFDPKPSNDGPTPLVQSIVLSIQDLPLRTLEFLVPAIKDDIAENPGHYLLTGDYNGIIPIQDVIVTLLPVVAGQPARATIELVFWDFGADATPFTLDDIGGPLPDDRFTLFVNDEGIIDRAGNILDGESNADEPHDQDAAFPEILGVDGFPTGDGLPGGDFLARFTIDSRPEVGTWGAGSAWIDTNGNTSFDPTNADFTNRDITYMMGFTSDDLFAGNFALGAGDTADGFDKLAAYGRVNGAWRWVVDTDNDGVPNVNQVDPAGINGLPFAGNFDGNAANGDEVGVFTGTTWWFDTNHDFQVDFSIVASPGFVGYPVVGDFDGDGAEDLGAWTDDTFRFNLSSTGPTLNANLAGLTGTVERSFRFGFSGPNERPVAADVNQDGFDDIGLYVPNRAGVSPDESAEWYILVSGLVQNNDDNGPAVLGPSIIDRIVTDPIDGQPVVRFTPVPFGRDIYVQYGDEFGLPILGNFDPPVTASSGSTPVGSTRDPRDVNNDGRISAFDALLIINHMNQYGPGAPVAQTQFPQAPFLDVNGSGTVSASDAIAIVNYLNAKASGTELPAAEGEADEFFSELGASSSSNSDGDLLSLLADDLETQRRKQG